MFNTNEQAQRSRDMNTFRFAGMPGTDSIAAAVTFAVGAWLFVACGLMITQSPADSVLRGAPRATSVVYSAPAVAISPEARLVIVVEGHRA
jgi:hypothetical protein